MRRAHDGSGLSRALPSTCTGSATSASNSSPRRSRLRELAEAGTIPRAGGRYPLPLAVVSYCAHLREIAAGRGASGGGLDLVAERARLAAAQADKTELDLAVKRGQLVNAETLGRHYVGLITAARNRLRGVPSKAKGNIPDLDVRDIEILEDLIDTALTELADGTDEEDEK